MTITEKMPMKRVETSQLVPGMITAEDVYTYNGQLILSKGLTLNDKAITRLELYSILTIRIEESTAEIEFELPDPDDSNPDEWPFSKIIKNSPQFKEFQKSFDETLDRFRSNLNDIVEKGAPVDLSNMLKDTIALFEKSTGAAQFFNMLHNMRTYDDLTFAHSLNVSLICNVFAGWLMMSKDDIELATACGLLHDLGKLAIPDDIIKKNGKLTDEEYEIVKTHTIQGYQFLKNQHVSDHVKNAALMHHERNDGSGYPLAIKGDRIDKYAKIVAIADVYDAMTAARVYRGPLCPFKVIEIFEKEGFQKYETQYILTFLENVVLTYMNNRVRLNDGTIGEIIYINKSHLSRPMIKTSSSFIDLSKESSLYIDAIL